MIEQNKHTKALKAIHDLILEARTMAYNEVNQAVLAEFLDAVEYLSALLLEDQDRTSVFEDNLKWICKKYDCKFAKGNYFGFS